METEGERPTERERERHRQTQMETLRDRDPEIRGARDGETSRKR